MAPIKTEEELDQMLTLPRPVLVDFIRQVQSPLVILGAGGKMGPTLAVLARRAALQAAYDLEVVAVSRFSDPRAREWLEARGVHTLSLDLMERSAYDYLPDSTNILYLVGLKFGTSRNPSATWASMTLPAAMVCERYPRARLVALSSGNVYPLSETQGTGSFETDPLVPLGEYANACVARERIFEYFSLKNNTPLVLLRLFYAVDLRYGVLLDIAQKVQQGQPIDLAMPYLNCIWQGDANEVILRALSLASVPPLPLNVTSPQALSVRRLAEKFGQIFSRPPVFVGQETDTALLANCQRMLDLLGEPATPVDTIMDWTAGWVRQGGRTLNKPTHFNTRDGRY